ncbi:MULTISPECIES: DddA-like double-stranded DNA deaminase toxin [Actinosynnema]|uniref:DddA-like double-stranded DNA deaminase toxin n=1 Tax=Actinosynnema TaxID=40566 RepID=UPI0020A3780B|nr:DddA-like double-stranded DNA deaminase toxin [Actinosynnema pretiosum]MCP2097334.1 SCP1.201-like deaminase [Actinosynnema pretiosum]
MASIGEVVAALRQVIEDLPFAQLAAALDAAQEARDLIDVVARGSGQDEFFQVSEWFRQAAEGIEEIQTRLNTIQREATVAANRLEGDPATAPATSAGRTSPVPAVSDLPDVTPEALLRRLPVRSSPTDRTSGLWLDQDRTVRGPVHSGRGQAREQAVDVLRHLGISPPHGTLAVADHVEVQVAARVRSEGLARATLAVNNEPCRRGRFSCDRVLPRVLGPGQRLTVHWPGGQCAYSGREPL